MFERRLRLLLSFSVVVAAVLGARLFQLQVLYGAYYDRLSEAALERPPETLRPVRGRILDRAGRVLAGDDPAHDVSVHYGVLSMDRAYLARLEQHARREPALRGLSRDEAIRVSREIVRDRIADLWRRLSIASGLTMGELRERRDSICRRIEMLRRYLYNARGDRGAEESPDALRLAEDEMFHPVLRDISPDVRTRIEVELGSMPFVRVESAVRRVVQAPPELSHFIGRIGELSGDKIENDPFRDDPRRRYLPGEKVGISGVERLGEASLRGARGTRQRDRDGRVLLFEAPEDGRDVRLTIDCELQARIARVLEEAVAANPPSTGAACAIIDVPTREVLALVSVPSYDCAATVEQFRQWRDDTRNAPLLFRAAGVPYPPGSILKPAAMLAALSGGVATASTVIDCQGQLLPNVDAWHCWTHWRQLPPHGPLDAEQALQHSCNIYLYTIGQKLGAARLTDFYRRILYGPATARHGAGLPEESSGRIPTDRWMASRRGFGFQVGDGRNYALGQGEILVTPLLAANLFATIADGAYRDPTLLVNDPRPRPATAIAGVRSADWATVRNGLYRCANEPGGTAFAGAHMDELVICGKTGSAQSVARIAAARYRFRLDEGGEKSVVAPTVEAARERLGLPERAVPIERAIVSRWPPPLEGKTEPQTHAWFACFAPREDPRIALALVIEYGGSGGKVAAPVGRQVLETLLEHAGGILTRDAAYAPGPQTPPRPRLEDTE